MKRHRFRLANVLRFYELQKQRTELDLQRASRTLQETDAEIGRLDGEIASVASLMHGDTAALLTIAGWIACHRKTEQLSKWLTSVRERRVREAIVVAKLEEARKKWSIAEETLRSLKGEVDVFNHAQADKTQQDTLDETVLRQWLNNDHENGFSD